MVAFGRARERFGKTAGVVKLTDVFQFQWASTDCLEDEWLKCMNLMRRVNLTSLGNDARETLTIAGLEKAKERSLEQHLRLRAPQNLDCVVCKRGSVSANDCGFDCCSTCADRDRCCRVKVSLLWQKWR